MYHGVEAATPFARVAGRRHNEDISLVSGRHHVPFPRSRPAFLRSRPACVEFELFFRPSVDWDLFCPFKLDIAYEQRDCAACPSAAHVQRVKQCLEFKCVREDCLMVAEAKTAVPAGTYLTTEFKEANVNAAQWQGPLDQHADLRRHLPDAGRACARALHLRAVPRHFGR